MWQAVKGFEDRYEVSNTGELRNKQRQTLVTPYLINSGYLVYRLYRKGKCTSVLAHRLVAEAFIPNPENKRTVNHKDTNKLNNVVCNLEWMTHSENHTHAFQHGRQNPTAFELGINKVSADDVRWIRANYKQGDKTFGGLPMSRRFGISVPSLLKIIRGQSYKSIT